MVKNPPANAGDTGLVPGPGRSHIVQSNEAHEPQLLSLCSRAWGLQFLKAAYPKPHMPPLENSLRSPQLEESSCTAKYIYVYMASRIFKVACMVHIIFLPSSAF